MSEESGRSGRSAAEDYDHHAALTRRALGLVFTEVHRGALRAGVHVMNK